MSRPLILVWSIVAGLLLLGLPSSSSGALLGVLLAVAVLAVAGLAGRAAPRPALAPSGATLRSRDISTAGVFQRDPDAAGRARPRAPSAGHPAA